MSVCILWVCFCQYFNIDWLKHICIFLCPDKIQPHSDIFTPIYWYALTIVHPQYICCIFVCTIYLRDNLYLLGWKREREIEREGGSNRNIYLVVIKYIVHLYSGHLMYYYCNIFRKNLVKIPLGLRDIKSFWWDVEEFTFFINNYKLFTYWYLNVSFVKFAIFKYFSHIATIV